MKKVLKKEIIISLIILILVISTFVIIKNKNKNNVKNEETHEEYIEEEEGLTGLIENEQYYYDKQKEYNKISDEYDTLVQKFASERFTDEQKAIIREYQNKKIEAMKNKDKETKLRLSKELSEIYRGYMEQQFTSEQKDIINERRKKIEELQPIVDEYQELIIEAQERKSKEGLEILEGGKVKNNRQGIVEEKEYDGIKFNEIQLIYDPIADKTTISMKATNSTNEVKGDKLVTLNFTGNTSCKYLMRLEKIQAGEYTQIELPMDTQLEDTDKLEIIDFNEKDYEKITKERE